MRVLVDTSVWIDWFSNRNCREVDLLNNLVHDGQELAICGPILAEVLGGTRSDVQYRRVQEVFQILDFLPMTVRTYDRSADIYRQLRRQGITLKNAVDTFIAAVALEQQVPLLQNDSDFSLIAREFPLDLL